MEHVMVMNVSLESHHTPQGDVGNHTDLKFPSDCKSYYTPQGDTDDRPALLHNFVRRSGAAAFL